MENALNWAREQDAADALNHFRTEFYFPQHAGKNVLYFTGNSLGLQPKGVQSSIQEELDAWKTFGVEGHFEAKRPWFNYHEFFTESLAKIVGANSSEVVCMNQLTVNLHLLLISFYRPKGKRVKILFEYKPFPSDRYAFESQAKLHGLDPNEVLVEMQPRAGEVLIREEDILAKISELGDELAIVCFGAVNYFSGQLFPVEKIGVAAHAVGALIGLDLAHAAGNVPLQLHQWNIDFACWCSYKYMNSGPGGVSGIYVHERFHGSEVLRLAGWWGNKAETRFLMGNSFDPTLSAEAWQLSNAPVFSMAVHRAALDLFDQAGMEQLRMKSERLTAYLEFIFDDLCKTGIALEQLTSRRSNERGCQLSVRLNGKDKSFVKTLASEGVVVDWREPDVIRMAPVPLYNSFEDVFQFGQIMRKLYGIN
ncbi:MAG: kynureninase [Bacteroidetes bacterium]|nr:kynureninase [Bacteroidota bacterium]